VKAVRLRQKSRRSESMWCEIVEVNGAQVPQRSANC
jgi:hypothetical protein